MRLAASTQRITEWWRSRAILTRGWKARVAAQKLPARDTTLLATNTSVDTMERKIRPKQLVYIRNYHFTGVIYVFISGTLIFG